MRLRDEPKLRRALHGLYVALFEARKLSPDDFKDSRLTTIQTAFMGVEDCGWRVIGITPEALELLATMDFHKHKLPRRLCRGHVVDRIQTTRALFAHAKPLNQKRFFETFLANDCTVIMLVEQNRGKSSFPRYLDIDNPDADFFPNGGLIGWKQRKKERDFLAVLHTDFKKGRCLTVDSGRSPDKPVRMAKRHADSLSKKPRKAGGKGVAKPSGRSGTFR